MASVDEEKLVKENYGSTLKTVGAMVVLQIIIMRTDGENLNDNDCASELTLRVRDELLGLFVSIGQVKKQFKFIKDFKKIDNGDAMNSFDLTLLSQIFEMIGGPKGEPRWEELMNLIRDLRDKRNEVAHSVGTSTYTRMNVDNLFDELISLCSKLIETSGSYYSKDRNYITLLVDAKVKEISWKKERLIEQLNKNASDLLLYNVSTVKDESEKLANVTKELQQVYIYNEEISQKQQDKRNEFLQQEIEEIKEKLEKNTLNFFNWMKYKIRDLKENNSPNSIEDIKKLLYKHEENKSKEKPIRESKRDEIYQLLMKINKKLNDLNMPTYVPKNGHQLQDIENVLGQLEEALNTREDELNEKLVILRDLYLLPKFGVKDMLTIIRSSVMREEPQTTRESILYIISRIIMLDYSSRQSQLSFKGDECKNKSNDSLNTMTDDSDDGDDEFQLLAKGSSIVHKRNNINPLHPSDVITIIMNLCDNTVRQFLVQKMVMCQLAIPLVFTNISSDKPLILLQTMQLMNMNLKTQLKGQNMNLVDYPAPIISAVRFGDLNKSKSHILNNILCGSKHDVFFHKDCVSGHLSRKFSEGVIELAWYMPGGSNENVFDNIISLFNLRGNVKNHIKQFEFVSKVSSIMLIFYSINSISDHESCSMLKKLSTLNQKLIFIFLDEISKESSNDILDIMGNKKFKSVLRIVNGQLKNDAMLTIEIIKKINEHLKKCQKEEQLNFDKKYQEQEKMNWEKISEIAGHLGIEMDKSSECCKKGKNLADTIINEVMSIHGTTIKNNILPLQGKLWEEWSALSKKQARLIGVKGENHENFISECIQLKEECLEKQCNLIENMNPVMSKFIQILRHTKHNPNTRDSFVQWMKFYLDGMSHKNLPELQADHHSLWKKVQEKPGNIDINEAKKRLEILESNLISASFGLEHFMREVGQVYEAIFKYKKDTSHKFISYITLPNYAAELLISGIPFEVMDGDVGHMPITWVSAVFDCLKSKLGYRKVYVISVLGLQSSGKSTLLNTMFGLNFSVSAGRCTKGVFAQLVPVDSYLKNDLGYEYILVLDTEGLRAPEIEKSKLNHDNQLATMIIGMGDVTIVNIMGENMTEIKDILEICVHAFLRMQLKNKSLQLQPGCYFIHQNVSAVNADEKMSYGQQIILDQLNIISKAAARQEGSKEIESFKDVIDFNEAENVWYFPNLWQGDPPMAPVNPNYTRKVLDLKAHVLKYPTMKNRNCLTITDIKLRMSDIWNAILYENFLFSFRNSREVKAYKSLEVKYSSVSWNLRKEVKKWTYGAISEIFCCEEKNIVNLQGSIIHSLNTCIDENFSKIKKELDTFFIISEYKDILNKWKSEIDIRYQIFNEELKYQGKKNFMCHFEIRRAQFVKENESSVYKDQLHEYVKVFVTELYSKYGKKKLKEMSEESLKDVFAKKWNEWIKTLSFDKIQEKDIIDDVKTLLIDYFKANRHLLEIELPDFDMLELENNYLNIQPNIDYKIFGHDASNTMSEIQTFTHTMLSDIKSDAIEVNKLVDYDMHLISDIIYMVNEKVINFNNDKSYELQINYLIKVTVYILRSVLPLLKNRHKQFINSNDPEQFLEENVKPQLETYFLGAVLQCMEEKTAADMLISYVERDIVKKVKRELPQHIADSIRCKYKEFHTKINLYSKVIEDLGNEKDFIKYIEFICNPNKAMNNWIRAFVYKYCADIHTNHNSYLAKEANEIVSNVIKALTKSLKEVNTSVGNNSMSFKEWLKKYQNIVKQNVSLQNTIFDSLELEEVKHIDYFEEQIILGFKKLPNKVELAFSQWSVAALNDLDENPHELLASSILGCTEQCPFCWVVCTNTIAGHEGQHSNPQHRPGGIGGSFKAATHALELESCNVRVAGEGTFYCTDSQCHCQQLGDPGHPYRATT